MKKILFIISKSEMGGAQRFLYELVTHLDPEKYEISVAAGRNGKLFEKLAAKNIKTFKIKNFSNVFGIKNVLAFFEISRIIKNKKPDIVYLLSSEAGFSGSIAAFFYRFGRSRPKIIYRIGGWAFKEPRNIFIKKIYLWAEKLSAPFKNIIIVNSEFDRRLAIKNKIAKPEKIIIIYNGLDLNEIEFLSRAEAVDSLKRIIHNSKFIIHNSILIGTIANLYKNKGLEYLILAIARISNDQKFNFVIIGEGPEKEELKQLIKEVHLENSVFLTGYVDNAYRYLKAFDVFALSSVKEGQPWTILEAMAADVPIVATNIAGIPETIENEKSGLLVEPADSQTLADAIQKITFHPSLAHKCALNALKTLKEKFSLRKMIQKNEELFL